MKAIIFDFFGVISSEVAPRWFRKYFSPEHSQKLKEQFFRPADLGSITPDAVFDELGQLVGSDASSVKKEFDKLVELNFELVDMIKELKKKYLIGLCSNSMSSFVRSIMAKYHLEELFDVVVVSSEIGLAKPDEKIYLHCLKELGVKAGESIFIDDNPINVDSAKLIGMEALLFVNNEMLRKELKNYLE